MKLTIAARHLSLIVLVTACTALMPVAAQINLMITIAPPAQTVEVVPRVSPGYVWVPGYWAWHTDRYIWVGGRQVVQRVGYRWAPDNWERRGETYYRNQGHWVSDGNQKIVKAKKIKAPKHADNGNHYGQNKERGKDKDYKKNKKNKENKGNKGNNGKGH